MTQTYVVFNKTSGRIVAAGRIDKDTDEQRKDGSTTLERIENALKNAKFDVVYFETRQVPMLALHKIDLNSMKITALNALELSSEEEEQNRRRKISQEIRTLAIESLKQKGDLPADYSEKIMTAR